MRHSNLKRLSAKIICCFTIILFIFKINVNAQKVWTLQECLDYALKNNIQIKQNILNSELLKEDYKQSITNLFPDLSGNASHNYTFGRKLDPFTNQFLSDRTQYNNFSLNSSLVVFNGFQLINTLKRSQLNYIASKYDIEKIKNDVSLNIVASFLQVLYNQDLAEASKLQLETSEMQLNRIKRLVEAGGLPKGDLLNIESQVASEELKLINDQNQLNLSYLNLAQLLDLDSINNFFITRPELQIPNEDFYKVSPQKIYEVALENQPQIKSIEYKLQSAKKNLASARGSRSPLISLNWSYNTGYSEANERITSLQYYGEDTIGYTPSLEPVTYPSYLPTYEIIPFNEQFDDNKYQAIGINFSIPFFNGWQAQTAINKAKISVLIAEYDVQTSKSELNKSIQQAYADALAGVKKYNASHKSMEASKETLKYTEQKFNLGLINSVDYTTAKTNYNKSEVELLQSKYDYILKIKILDFYQGKALTF